MTNYQLKEWDLSELVKNPKSAVFQKQIQELKKQATKFEKIKSKLNPKMTSKEFENILQQVEKISENMGKLDLHHYHIHLIHNQMKQHP